VIEECQTKQQLLGKLVPFEDGLIISDGLRRATFLPSVWAQLPDKSHFVEHLMQKAASDIGLNPSCVNAIL
jgi:AMMECR1 domain-containing protein